MRYAQSSPRRGITLRFRLMVWNAIVVIVTALVTLIGLREGVRWTLIHELDQLLTEDVREIELALANVGGSTSSLQLQQQLDRKDAGHAQHKWFVQLIDSQNVILYESEHAPVELSTPVVKSKTPQTANGWRYFGRDVGDVTVRVGSSLQWIHDDVVRIDRIVAMAVGVVLLVAPLTGYWLAGSTTRPLNQMISTMAGLRPSRLDDRLSLRGTGDELDRLSSTFNRLLDRIGNYLQERRDFLANAAHELRTPLAAIRSSIEVTLNKKRSTDEYEALLTEVIEESASLELLVNQLLLLAETEAERLRVHSERVRLDELVEKSDGHVRGRGRISRHSVALLRTACCRGVRQSTAPATSDLQLVR
jgi:two-component system, OmpR family, heavy metal sensor histidine kinase CusS